MAALVRLYISGRTRRWMIAIAVVAVVGWFATTMLDAGVRPGFASGVGWTLLAAGLTLFAVAMRSARRPQDECAFCGAPRAKVQRLVAGTSAAICEGCAPLSLAVMAEDLAGRKPPGPWQRLLVDSLPARCPVGISRPLLEALAAGGADAGMLRAVASVGIRLQNHAVAVEILTRIPEAERQPRDWLNLAYAQGSLGRYEEAARGTETALERDDGDLRVWGLNNRAWFGLRQRPDASVEVRTAWLRDVEEAKRLLAAKRPAGWQALMQSCHGTEAELRRSLGDLRGALQTLSEAEALGPLGGERHLIRARVLASGDPPLGRHDVERALELLHPDSPYVREARDLLATFPAQI